MHQLPTGTVTLLFTDIEGSTRLLQQVGEGYSDLLAHCRQVLRMAFQQHNGHEIDTQGDAFFVAFARATDAVSAAADAQRALAAQVWPEGMAVRVRMGLHTGEPLLASEGYVGLDVHHAARIMSAGHGGQVLLSHTTSALVAHDLPTSVSLRELGAHRLKDLEHPSQLFQLVIEDLPADFPPLRTLDRHAHNLPVQLTPLIGREKEVAMAAQLLRRDDVRLLTLTGPGGIGKTRLGLQVAAELSDQFADGVCFVDLAPISDPDLVLPTIAQTLGVTESATRSMLDVLRAFLQEKPILLMLDNFEQVLGAGAEVAALLARCPQLNVLVTSRAALHLSGEHRFPVTPLTLPDPRHLPDLIALSQYEAVALFIARAKAIRPDFQVTNATAPAVAEICVRLDGLPLAIELAAARITLLSPQALLARLGQRFTLLVGGTQDAHKRQQTLRNTIAWSYDLLDAKEQRLFRRLCVFVGGATLEAIEAVSTALGDEPASMLDGIGSLIDKSLLRQSEQEDEQPRFVMLETIREYGWEALSANREAESTRKAHAAYYLALTEEAAPQLHGLQMAQWLGRLEKAHDNLRTAMGWLLERGEAAMALRMGAALVLFWELNYYYHEGWNFLERALVGSEEVAVPVRAKALVAAGTMAGYLGDFERGEALCQESLALFRAIGDKEGMGNAVFHLATVTDLKGDFAVARSLYEECLVLSREANNKALIAWTLNYLAAITIRDGEYARARPLIEESRALFRELDYTLGIADSLQRSAIVLFFQGDLDQARELAEEQLALFREIGIRTTEAWTLCFLGEITFYQGDITTARLLTEQSCRLFREMRNKTQIAWTNTLLGKIIAVQGDLATARALYEENLIRGQGANSDLSFEDAVPALEGLAAVVAAQGEPTWAARLWGKAEAHRNSYGLPLAPVYRTSYEQAVAMARAQLDESTFTAAWAEGGAMALEQVFAARGPVMISAPLPMSQPAVPPAKKSLPSYPGGLTVREVEVLGLVAQGLSNAQVADRLVISPRTVNTHLTSIYGKIGVTSRSAATRYAIEHHLV